MKFNRRTFFKNATAGALLPFSVMLESKAATKSPVINDLQLWKLVGERPPSEEFIGWIQANPSKIYDTRPPVEPLPPPASEKFQMQEAYYLKILTNTDSEGLYGPIDWDAAQIVMQQFKPFLLGKNPLQIEWLWEQLFRRNRHSRAGYYMMAVSAVDNTLWDLRGKHFGVPVYQLLGGPTRDAVQVYASCLGFSVEPEQVRMRARKIAAEGYQYQKWFFSWGTGQGRQGLEKNIHLVKTLRETVGDNTELMFDAFMGWDLDYAIEWAKAVEEFSPRWMEEAFLPTAIDSYVRLRNSTSIPIAAGEHLYNRWEVQEYLSRQAVSVVQTDPEWCGGITELTKICALASAYNVVVVPHGHSLHAALHVIAAQSPAVCPYAEYLINKMDYYHLFEKNPLRVENGQILLRNDAGFGITWDESKILRKEQIL